MLKWARNYAVKNPALFSFCRKFIDVGYSKKTALIEKVFDLNNEDHRILDIGCGTGDSRQIFRKNNYTGIDISPEYIAYARMKHPGEYKVMDGTQLRFEKETFDYILIMAVLHHLDNPTLELMLTEASRVLKSSGKMVVMENARIPEKTNPLVTFFQLLDMGNFIRTPEEYKKLIGKYFKIFYETSFMNGFISYFALVLEKI